MAIIDKCEFINENVTITSVKATPRGLLEKLKTHLEILKWTVYLTTPYSCWKYYTD